MLKRVQLVIDEQQERALRALAGRRGRSMSQTLREILDGALRGHAARREREELAGFITGRRGKRVDPDEELYSAAIEPFKKRRTR